MPSRSSLDYLFVSFLHLIFVTEKKNIARDMFAWCQFWETIWSERAVERERELLNEWMHLEKRVEPTFSYFRHYHKAAYHLSFWEAHCYYINYSAMLSMMEKQEGREFPVEFSEVYCWKSVLYFFFFRLQIVSDQVLSGNMGEGWSPSIPPLS